jgi:hypothetical protein
MSLINQSSKLSTSIPRSQTNLIKSPGDAPSGQWMLDQTLAGLFSYPYAVGRRLSKVVIPKGTIVGVTGRAKDYLTGKYRNTLGFASPTVNAIGVAPYSYFQRFTKDAPAGAETWSSIIAHDEFGADDFQPSITTREFIEVPYLPNPEDVFTYSTDATPAVNGMKMMYGCATNGSVDVVGTNTELTAGDYVKAGPYGKFVKWVSGVDAAQLIVGQVLELDTDMPPLGWLKYVEPVYEGRDSARENNVVEPAPADGSTVWDPDYTYPYTAENMGWNKPGAWKTIGNGIPGLTDGAKMALTSRIQRFTLNANATSLACILDPVAKIDEDSLTVTLNGTALSTAGTDKYAYDKTTQIVTITAEGVASARDITITYTVDNKSIIGVPASWDFAGSIGVARILLKF